MNDYMYRRVTPHLRGYPPPTWDPPPPCQQSLTIEGKSKLSVNTELIRSILPGLRAPPQASPPYISPPESRSLPSYTQAENFKILHTMLPYVGHKQRQHEQKLSHMFSPLIDVSVCSILIY